MKRVCSMLVTLMILLACCNVAVSAETSAREQEVSTLIDLLRNPENNDYICPFDPSLLPEEYADFTLEGQAVLFIFKGSVWRFMHLPLEEAIENAYELCLYSYRLISGPEKAVTKRTDRAKYIVSDLAIVDHMYGTPTYVLDVLTGDAVQSFLGAEHGINSIICFDGHGVQQYAAVLYFTDGGVFVRHYDYPNSEAVEYTLEEYQIYAAAYYEYLTAYETNYNEKGEPLNGGSITFSDFIENVYSPEANDTRNPLKPTEINNIIIILVIIFVCVVVLFLCIGRKTYDLWLPNPVSRGGIKNQKSIRDSPQTPDTE